MRISENEISEADDEPEVPFVQTLSAEWLQTDRLRSFDDIVGQAHAVKSLRAIAVQKPQGKHVILHGPAGVGKRAISLLYGQALHCTSVSAKGTPCRKCYGCKTFESSISNIVWDFIEVEEDRGPNGKDLGYIAYIRDLFSEQSLFGGRVHVYIFDRVDEIKEETADSLLACLESSRTTACCIFLATDINRVRPALRSRCSVYMITRLKRGQSLSRLQELCQSLRISYENPALDIISAQSDFKAGTLLYRLSEVSSKGKVTNETARAAFDLEWVYDVVSIWKSILLGDLDLVESELVAWCQTSSNIIYRLRCSLLALELYESANEFQPPAFLHQGSSVINSIAGCISAKAEELGVSNEKFQQSLLMLMSQCETGASAVELAEVLSLSTSLQSVSLLM